MLTKFSGVESKRTVSKFRKRKSREIFWDVFTYSLSGRVKLESFMSWSWNDGYEIYKKAWCSCKVVLLICLITFLPFSLLSPSSFLKLPIVLIQKFCYHGNMTSLFSSLLSPSQFSSSLNNVITPASQWSANSHFTLPITPFVTPHLRATCPAHFHLIDVMCLIDNVLYL